MSDELSDQCLDHRESITVELPCQLIDRLKRYAHENQTSVSGLMIEALDSFLRQQDKK